MLLCALRNQDPERTYLVIKTTLSPTHRDENNQQECTNFIAYFSCQYNIVARLDHSPRHTCQSMFQQIRAPAGRPATLCPAHWNNQPRSAAEAHLCRRLASPFSPWPPQGAPTRCIVDSLQHFDYHLTTLPPYHLTTLPPYHLTTLPPYHLTTLPPYNLTTLPTRIEQMLLLRALIPLSYPPGTQWP